MGKRTADNLREAIMKKRMTMSEVSKRTGVSISSISQYLSGRCAPNNVNAKKLAEVLDVSVAYIMGLDSDQEKTSDPILNEVTRIAEDFDFQRKKMLLDYVRLLSETCNKED